MRWIKASKCAKCARHVNVNASVFPPTCPAPGTATLVLVQRQQGAAAAVGTGVAGEAGGVLGLLAVVARVAQGAGAGGRAGHQQRRRHHGRRAVPAVQAGVGVAGVLVLAVVPQEARSTPAHTGKIKINETKAVAVRRVCGVGGVG